MRSITAAGVMGLLVGAVTVDRRVTERASGVRPGRAGQLRLVGVLSTVLASILASVLASILARVLWIVRDVVAVVVVA